MINLKISIYRPRLLFIPFCQSSFIFTGKFEFLSSEGSKEITIRSTYVTAQ